MTENKEQDMFFEIPDDIKADGEAIEKWLKDQMIAIDKGEHK